MSTLTTEQRSSNDPLFEECLRWVEEGVRMSRVEAQDMGEKGRGLVASRDIQPGETVCEIPERFVISPHTVKYSDVKIIIEKELALGETAYEHPHTRLVFLVLYESTNPKSFWKPYWAVMPTSYDLPSCWTQEQLNEVAGSTLYEEIISLNEKIKSSYDDLILPTIKRHPEYLSEERQSYEAYRWALHTVYSRQYTYDEEAGCLVPFADLVNHRSELDGTDSNYYYDKATDTFKVIVNEHYKKGDEIFISYGRKSNEQYMLCYGFYNPLQSEYRFDIPDIEVAFRSRKDKIIADNQLEKNSFTLRPDESPDDLIKLLRILMMSERELDTNQQEHALAGKTISPENEQMVYYTVIQLIDWMLERYPTTAEQDVEMLTMLPAGIVRRAVIFRRKEKNFLRGMRSLFEAYVEDAIENGAVPQAISLALHRDYLKLYETNQPLF